MSRYVPTGQAWIDVMFSAQQVDRGGVIRRSRSDVNAYASHELLLAEVQRRRFHLVLSGNQYVVFCHAAPLRIFC